MHLLRGRDDLVCQQVVELVTDYLDGVLSRKDRRRFEAHLRACPNCTNYLDQMRETIRVTGSLGVDNLAPEALDEFTRLYREWNRGSGS